MSNQAPPAPGQVRYMQGIAVPEQSVRPTEFFARTRRRTQSEYTKPFAGLGQQDVVELKKTDILAGLTVRLTGSVTITPGTGTAGTTARYPHDLLKQCRFTANGASNVINVSGMKLKVHEFMAKGDTSDRGIAQSINGATVTQGTLSQACEAWGVGSRASNIAGGTYSFDLEWFVPVAEDQIDLSGAIFAATSSTDLTLTLDWAQPGDVFNLTGNATAAVSGQVQVEAIRYAIPQGADGQIVVPDLSVFHSLIQSNTGAIGNGINEPRLVGQGAGKTLLRVYSQLWNGSGAASVPLAVNGTNFGRMGWRYGGNETPDEYVDGGMLRIFNERTYNTDIAAQFGFFAHDFAAENAFRDTIDLGTTSEWRQLVEVASGVTLTSPRLEVVTESIFQAGAGS